MIFMSKSCENSRTRAATLEVFYIEVEVGEMNRIAKVKYRDRGQRRRRLKLWQS